MSVPGKRDYALTAYFSLPKFVPFLEGLPPIFSLSQVGISANVSGGGVVIIPVHKQVVGCRREAATIYPRPGLQVVTRYTSYTHIWISHYLDVQVGLPVQPTKVAW